MKWPSWTFGVDPAKNLIYGVGSEVAERIKLEQEEKEIAEQLRENELKLRLIIDNISDGVIVANMDRKYFFQIAAVITIKDISNYRQLGEKLTDTIGFKKESQ